MKTAMTVEQKKAKRKFTIKQMKENWLLYVFLLPAVLYVAIFSYWPLYGVQIAFKKFDSFLGIWGSEWVGFYWFKYFLSSSNFMGILWNTISLSLYSLIAGFPIPIILALVINSMNAVKFKKFCQTATYVPHFISMVVLIGMISTFLSTRSGFITTMLEPIFGEKIYFMGDPKYFQHIYVWSGVWQNSGWGSIIYIAALSGVSPEHHEAATIDGANRFKRLWYVDIPVIIPTMVILLVLQCGSIMNVGFEKVLLLQNDLTISVSEVISTYTYKLGLQQMQYSYSTAVGLFNNVINFTVLLIANKAAKLISGSSLW